MHELYLRRRENLRRLARDRGGQARFAEELGYTRAWLSQLIGKTPERDLSEKVAREIEQKSGIPIGSLDVETVQSGPQPEGEQLDLAGILATNLRELMTARGINQSELARRAGMATTSVNRVFNALDNGVSPRLETLEGIARGLGVQASELLKADPTAPDPAPHEPPFTVARQLARLIEDFLLCTPEQRTELLGLAAEASSKQVGRKATRG